MSNSGKIDGMTSTSWQGRDPTIHSHNACAIQIEKKPFKISVDVLAFWSLLINAVTERMLFMRVAQALNSGILLEK